MSSDDNKISFARKKCLNTSYGFHLLSNIIYMCLIWKRVFIVAYFRVQNNV